MSRRTPPRQAKRKPTDVRHSSQTLSPVNAAGESTLQRINADDSPDDLSAVLPPPRRPSKAGMRGMVANLFSRTAGAKRAKKATATPVTVRARTAVSLLVREFGGNVRPPRPQPVNHNGTWFCPLCRYVSRAPGRYPLKR